MNDAVKQSAGNADADLHFGTSGEPWQASVFEGKSPEERVLTHPFFGKPTVRTPPTIDAYHACKERMLSGIGGFLVLGEPGMGCRTALKVMHGYLAQEYPHMAVVQHILSRFRPKTPGAALSSMLGSAGHSTTGGSHVSQLRRLTNMLEEKALMSGSPLSVMFLHNAEHVNEDVCKAVLDLRDALQLRGVRLFLISGAHLTPFMQQVSKSSESYSVSDIRSIFGSAYYLRYLEGIQDYATVLAEIDTLPVGGADRITWGEALLPVAYRAGFRLSKQAETLHAAITDRVPSGRLSTRSLFDVVRNVLSVAVSAGLDSADFGIPQETWAEAVSVVLSIGHTYLPDSTAGTSLEGGGA